MRCGNGWIARRRRCSPTCMPGGRGATARANVGSDIVFENFRFDFLINERARPVLTVLTPTAGSGPRARGRRRQGAAAARHAAPRPRPPRPASARRRRARSSRCGAAAAAAASHSRRRAPRAAACRLAAEASRARRRRPRRRSTAGAASRRRPTTTSRRRCGARRRGATPSCAACCAEGYRFSLRSFGRASSIVCVRLVQRVAARVGRLSTRAPERQCAASSHERKADAKAVDAVEHRHLRRALGVAARRARAAPDLAVAPPARAPERRECSRASAKRRRHRAAPRHPRLHVHTSPRGSASPAVWCSHYCLRQAFVRRANLRQTTANAPYILATLGSALAPPRAPPLAGVGRGLAVGAPDGPRGAVRRAELGCRCRSCSNAASARVCGTSTAASTSTSSRRTRR